MTKGKVSLKTVIVVVIMLLVGVLSVLGVGAAKTYLSSASAGAEPKGVLTVSTEDGKGATVSWMTDKAAQGVVEYGTTPASLLLRNLETDAVTDHKVSLTTLKPNTSYYFRIRVGEEVFDNSGIPYSFKTKGSTVTTTPTTAPALVPTVAVLPTGVGGCDRTTDYDGNGTVNSVDYLKCVKDGVKTAPVATKAAEGNSDCKFGVDYNGDGVINTVDRISCLQKKH
jgi:hypothetical protein